MEVLLTMSILCLYITRGEHPSHCHSERGPSHGQVSVGPQSGLEQCRVLWTAAVIDGLFIKHPLVTPLFRIEHGIGYLHRE